MRLSKQAIKEFEPQSGLVIPDVKVFELPEKVLQFGTGVLLRGLPDYFIDKANRQGLFNGRIVVVKSTANGGTNEFEQQDGLYTQVVRGVEKGNCTEEIIINASISRVVAANDNWDTILACARNPEMQVVISNTTEVGIALVEDDIRLSPPLSFPGKLLAFLYERYKHFKGSIESGMVILPTELVTENGSKLKSIVSELARMNKLETDFIKWLDDANQFCNTLVDRIVPGKLPLTEQNTIEKRLGYTDGLMILSESFRLWAIESSSPRVKEILSFAAADEGLVIAPDIEKFRELKLRLLNGTHTFTCALAYLAGFETVREAMGNEQLASVVNSLTSEEIAPAISGEKICYEEAVDFAKKVIDRFRNPHLDHRWLSISVQYTSKMRMRNIPLILNHYARSNQPPALMSLGFAAYILFMKSELNAKSQYEGVSNGAAYTIQDDQAGLLAAKWKDAPVETVVEVVLSDSNLWGTDLTQLDGLADAVKNHLNSLLKNGPTNTIRRLCLNKTVAE